ncbi:MAG: hypothetical protein ACYTEQ_27380 [Planctomycetota bacterium]|jgi:hypothetical protein
MTGLELIAEERREQVEIHGYDAAHDRHNDQGELAESALCVLAMAQNHDGTAELYWPASWSYNWQQKVEAKDRMGKLIVAGALIAAELDRMQQ